MHVGLHNSGYEYTIRGTVISTTEEERDIGVAVTKTLKPTAQSSKTAGRAAAVLGQLQGIFTSETGTVHICEVIQTVCAASSGLHGYKEI